MSESPSFYDLSPEERGAITDRAEEATGMSFYDLPPAERAAWTDRER